MSSWYRWDLILSCFTLRVSGDPTESIFGQAGIGISLSIRSEHALSEWIPVKGCLCAVRTDDSVPTSHSLEYRRCLFIIFIYAPTEYKFPEIKDEIHRGVSRLLRSVLSTDVLIVASNSDGKLGYLAETRWHIRSRFSVPFDCIHNGDPPSKFDPTTDCSQRT